MSEGRGSGSKGLAFNLGSAALPLVGSFVVSILLAPYLGDQAWGEYSLVLSAATLLLILAKFGLHAATSRLLSENEENPGPWLRAGLWWRTMFTLGTAALALLAAPWLARSFGLGDSTGPFWWVGPIVVSVSFFEWAAEALVGLRAFRSQMTVRLAALALRLAAVGVVHVAGLGLGTFLFGHAAAQAIPAVVVIVALLARHRGTDAGGQARRRTIDLAFPLAFSSASFLIYSHTDRLMLGWMHEASTVGQFAVARNVLDAAMFPMAALAWSLRPALVRALAGKSGLSFGETLTEGLRLSVLYTTLALAGLAVLGPSLVDGLYRGAYPEGERLLLWLLPVLVLRCIGTIHFPALVALDRQSSYARLMLATAVVNVVANLALIPQFAARGAIVATWIALLVLTIGGFVELRRGGSTTGIRGAVAPTLLSTFWAGAVAVGAWALRDAGLAVQLVGLTLACTVAAGYQLWRRPPRMGR